MYNTTIDALVMQSRDHVQRLDAQNNAEDASYCKLFLHSHGLYASQALLIVRCVAISTCSQRMYTTLGGPAPGSMLGPCSHFHLVQITVSYLQQQLHDANEQIFETHS